ERAPSRALRPSRHAGSRRGHAAPEGDPAACQAPADGPRACALFGGRQEDPERLNGVPTLVRRDAPDSPALDPRRVRRLGDRMLEALGLKGAELSVLLTDDARIRELNREHRHKDRPTDVLAFALDGPTLDSAEPDAGALLGDI